MQIMKNIQKTEKLDVPILLLCRFWERCTIQTPEVQRGVGV